MFDKWQRSCLALIIASELLIQSLACAWFQAAEPLAGGQQTVHYRESLLLPARFQYCSYHVLSSGSSKTSTRFYMTFPWHLSCQTDATCSKRQIIGHPQYSPTNKSQIFQFYLIVFKWIKLSTCIFWKINYLHYNNILFQSRWQAPYGTGLQRPFHYCAISGQVFRQPSSSLFLLHFVWQKWSTSIFLLWSIWALLKSNDWPTTEFQPLILHHITFMTSSTYLPFWQSKYFTFHRWIKHKRVTGWHSTMSVRWAETWMAKSRTF